MSCRNCELGGHPEWCGDNHMPEHKYKCVGCEEMFDDLEECMAHEMECEDVLLEAEQPKLDDEETE